MNLETLRKNKILQSCVGKKYIHFTSDYDDGNLICMLTKHIPRNTKYKFEVKILSAGPKAVWGKVPGEKLVGRTFMQTYHDIELRWSLQSKDNIQLNMGWKFPMLQTQEQWQQSLQNLYQNQKDLQAHPEITIVD